MVTSLVEKPTAGAAHALIAQLALADLNRRRLMPTLGDDADWRDGLDREHRQRLLEDDFIADEREAVAAQAAVAPTDADVFVAWFEDLREHGPGQSDPLFPWLASQATMAQMRWFLTQEAAGEAGFDDLLALTQVQLPRRAKLEAARNYWDEMGRGREAGMHGPMLERLVHGLRLEPATVACWEPLALANLMAGLAANRRFAYQSIGALGVIELTSPTRVGHVAAGLERLGVPASLRHYFTLHATVDLMHGRAWIDEVVRPLIVEDPARASAIAEGALMRLVAGQRCFALYRARFGLG